jgi:hypothetical protein
MYHRRYADRKREFRSVSGPYSDTLLGEDTANGWSVLDKAVLECLGDVWAADRIG